METNWSISLEHDEYEKNPELVIEDAITAVKETSKGYYVNLVTPSIFGNPEFYLKDPLDLQFGSAIDSKFIDQCGCGGYVYRVWRNK